MIDLAPVADRTALAIAFFGELFRVAMPGEIEVRALARRDDERMIQRFVGAPARAANTAIELDGSSFAVYFGMGPRITRRGTLAAVPRAAVVWVDLDPPKRDDWIDWRILAVRRIQSFAIQPSAVISSGAGFHLYWLLDQYVDATTVRAINLALAETLDGDLAVCAPNAILRAPGCYNRKRGEPVLVQPFGPWWAPGRRMQTYPVGVFPRAKLKTSDRSIGAPVMDALLARVREVAAGVIERGGDGRLGLLCPFHPDTHQSAVVWPEGNFLCSACGVNEPAWRWTRRREVASWRAVELVPKRRTRLATSSTAASPSLDELRAPRVAIKIVGPLLSRKVQIRESRGGIVRMAMSSDAGTKIPFASPEQLAIALRSAAGPMTYRTFWACVALAQRCPVAGGRGGEFTCRPHDIAALLGHVQVKDGRPHADARTGIVTALDALARTEIAFRWSKSGAPYTGPIVATLGRFRGCPDTRVLHRGVWLQLSGRSPAWAPWREEALRLDDDLLALYLLARFELREREVRGRAVGPLPLVRLATRAGVWNAERYAVTPGRYVASIARRFGEVPALGVVVSSGREPGLVLGTHPLPAPSLLDPGTENCSPSVNRASDLRGPYHSSARTVPPDLPDQADQERWPFPRAVQPTGKGAPR